MVSIQAQATTSTRDRIRNRIAAETHHAIHELDVELVGADLILSGRTQTFYAKQLATHAAFEAVQELLPSEMVVLTNRIHVT